MSNQVYFVRTKFVDVSGTTYGFRAFDEHEMTYNNSFPSDLPEDPQELLNIIAEHNDEAIDGLFDFIFENQKGAYFDGEYIPWEKLEGMLKKALGELRGQEPQPLE